jgi:hypothetical protein
VGTKLERIRELHGHGFSLRQIGKQVQVSPMTVMRALDKGKDAASRKRR